ncbi:hypothetical protein [Aquimarina intermedia]|uniref:Uncharacterized protein n=1 Tax=Aquimarina intermedia TaxID=350814 RepID=A0A5S5BYV4_9FLAO|nr:hypothetical protein [Aquimarina intermedia]TYP72237.1 hypothetical protein BD809_107122 [Aquimarina intermedia]
MYSKLLEDFRSNYMMYVPLMIILSSCMGSIAAMFILGQERLFAQYVELTLCVSVCMIFNAAILAQMKTKIVFNLLILSLLSTTLLILINI